MTYWGPSNVPSIKSMGGTCSFTLILWANFAVSIIMHCYTEKTPICRLHYLWCSSLLPAGLCTWWDSACCITYSISGDVKSLIAWENNAGMMNRIFCWMKGCPHFRSSEFTATNCNLHLQSWWEMKNRIGYDPCRYMALLFMTSMTHSSWSPVYRPYSAKMKL